MRTLLAGLVVGLGLVARLSGAEHSVEMVVHADRRHARLRGVPEHRRARLGRPLRELVGQPRLDGVAGGRERRTAPDGALPGPALGVELGEPGEEYIGLGQLGAQPPEPPLDDRETISNHDLRARKRRA